MIASTLFASMSRITSKTISVYQHLISRKIIQHFGQQDVPIMPARPLPPHCQSA